MARARGCADVRFGDVTGPASTALEVEPFRTIIPFGDNLGIGGTREGAGAQARTVDGAISDAWRPAGTCRMS